jgi:hypothetical protein
VFEKVRPTTHRENGSDPEPEVGLSEGRLALVQRYMLDAEEAEARVQDAVEKTKTEAQRRSQLTAQASAELQARTAERARLERERARRRAEQRDREAQELARSTPRPPVAVEFANEEDLRAAWAGVKPAGEGFAAAEVTWRDSRPSFLPVTKEERRSEKEAARVLAALEKREARERKALAKAAAKRRLTGNYRS